MNRRSTSIIIIAAATLVVLFFLCLFTGSVHIPAADVLSAITGGEATRTAHQFIILETRLPAALAAVLCGMALSVAGLLMQTTFDNPLAGPSILGISTGASLGVAIVMLLCGSVIGAWGKIAVLGGAIVGAAAILALLLAMSAMVRSAVMLLIVGILLGYLSSSAISLLNFFATREGVHAYVIWGLGSFSSVTLDSLPYFAVTAVIFTLLSLLYAKPLNALLLGEQYAASVGVNLRRLRFAMLIISGMLTAAATAWCGPIGFIGLVVPHIARLALQSSNHRILLPATALLGALVGALCQFLSTIPGSAGIIPINAITPIIGVPVILYIIIKRRSIAYFN